MKWFSVGCEIKICALFLLLCIGHASGVLLNGKCEADSNCGTLDSYCNNGTCSCIQDFTTFDDSCVKVIIPRVKCNNNANCKFRSRSMCVKGICTCRAFHHEENGQCIKSRDEPCDKDFQCYWGEKMKDRIGCVEDKCSCKPGYLFSDHRQCIADVPVVLDTSSAARTPFVPLIPLILYLILI